MSAKNVLPAFLFGRSRDKLRDLVGTSRDQLRDLVRRTRDWLTGDDVSIRVLCVMLYQQHYSPQNPTTDNKAGSAKQGLESQ